jgi:hypothetical protein
LVWLATGQCGGSEHRSAYFIDCCAPLINGLNDCIQVGNGISIVIRVIIIIINEWSGVLFYTLIVIVNIGFSRIYFPTSWHNTLLTWLLIWN